MIQVPLLRASVATRFNADIRRSIIEPRPKSGPLARKTARQPENQYFFRLHFRPPTTGRLWWRFWQLAPRPASKWWNWAVIVVHFFEQRPRLF